MTNPKRIQRKRTKGWRMPPGTVNVCRPTIFGNPFVGERAVEAYREWLLRVSSSAGLIARLFDVAITGKLRGTPWANADSVLKKVPELSGKDLACYCKIGQPCHADVLLEIANQ